MVALLAEDSGFDPAVQDDGGEEAETAEWSNAAARKRKGHGEEAAGDEDRWADGGGEEGEGEEEEEEPSGEGRPLPEDGGDGDAGDIDPAAAKVLLLPFLLPSFDSLGSSEDRRRQWEPFGRAGKGDLLWGTCPVSLTRTRGGRRGSRETVERRLCFWGERVQQ